MEMNAVIENTVAKIREVFPGTVTTGLILGSGLGDYADSLENPVIIPYREIEGHPVSGVMGHKGQYVIGMKNGKPVIAMQGRFHYYEGYPMQVCMLGVRVMKRLGVTHLIVTNAAGGTREEDEPGTIMLIRDHINFSGVNPLIGPNDDSFGTRFPDMTHAYDAELRSRALAVGREVGVRLKEGIYMMFSGPSFETPAEVRFARQIGADACGMSTVPEVIAANHCGIKVLAFSVLSNHAAGVDEHTLTHAEVQETADRVKDDFSRLITACIDRVVP